MLLHADFGGNAYVARLQGELVPMRPDWVDIILAPRDVDLGNETATIGYKRMGYAYWHDGQRFGNARPVVFLPDEVCHFAPLPDPCANYRGMSIYTPVVREIESDKQATVHKSKFFENAATPNLAVTLPKEIDAKDFDEFVESMDRAHKGAENAYKTLYLAGGADPTVIGQNFQQLDFKAVQGAGETRIAAAAGVGAIIANLSEGMQGSSLNAGNYTAAKRRFGDITMRQLWDNAESSLEVVVPAPDGAVLAVDTTRIAFLRDDQTDQATIAASEAQIIRTLGDGGWDPESIKAAMAADYDWSLLRPTGLLPVQLQPPGSGVTPQGAQA
jgi:phage portal protein BeeE